MALKRYCRDAEEMLMAEQDELAADTNTETEEIAEVEDLHRELLNPTELVFTQSRSLTSVRNYTSSVGRIYNSPGLTA